MLHPPTHILSRAGALAALALSLTACGGDSENPPASRSRIHGVAAIGAPISGGNVGCECSSGAHTTATTAADGSFAVELGPDDFPCVINVSGGIAHGQPQAVPLHSVAHDPGTANLTPLTDLMFASLVGEVPAAWHARATQGDIAAITADRLATAFDKLQANLASLPGKLAAPADFHPITTPFRAQKGDPADDLLENYARALQSIALSQPGATAKAAIGEQLTQLAYSAHAFTVPGWTRFPLGLEKLPDGRESLVLEDPTLGRKIVSVRGRDAEGNITQVDQTGPFTSILSLMGNRIGMLSGRDSHLKHTVSQEDASSAHYVYLSDEFKEVDHRELHGKRLAAYDDSKYANDVVLGADGKLTHDGRQTPPIDVSRWFSAEGARDGRGQNATVTRARAYQRTADGKTTYAVVAVIAMDPDVPEALPAQQGVLLAVSR